MKIGFFASDFVFLQPLIDYLKQDPQFEIQVFSQGNINDVISLCAWADISWVEWADVNAVTFFGLPKTSKINILRLHSYEAFQEWPTQLDWGKVDKLILVNESLIKVLSYLHPKVRAWSNENNTEVVYQGINFDKFKIPENKPFNKKIAYVGNINYKKDPSTLLNIFASLYKIDPEYTLHIAGAIQDSRYDIYMKQFIKQNNLPVFMDGAIPNESLPAWLADKTYTINTSLFESFCFSIVESVASGLLPICYKWYGFENLYHNAWGFTTIDEAIQLFKRLQPNGVINLQNIREYNRKYLQDKFDLQYFLKSTKDMIVKLYEKGQSK